MFFTQLDEFRNRRMVNIYNFNRQQQEESGFVEKILTGREFKEILVTVVFLNFQKV